jgi:hypothetical protein
MATSALETSVQEQIDTKQRLVNVEAGLKELMAINSYNTAVT